MKQIVEVSIMVFALMFIVAFSIITSNYNNVHASVDKSLLNYSALDLLLLYDKPTEDMKVIEKVDDKVTVYEYEDIDSGRTLIIVKGDCGAEISFKNNEK